MNHLHQCANAIKYCIINFIMIHLEQITSILRPTISSKKKGILNEKWYFRVNLLFLIVFMYYPISFITSTNDNVIFVKLPKKRS